MKTFLKILFGFIEVGLVVLIALFAVNTARNLSATGYDFGYRVFTEDAIANEPGQDVLVNITSDMSRMEIGELLEEKKLVRDGKLFYIQLMLSAYSKKIQPGTYTLNTSMTPKEMMVLLAGEEPATEEPGE